MSKLSVHEIDFVYRAIKRLKEENKSVDLDDLADVVNAARENGGCCVNNPDVFRSQFYAALEQLELRLE